VRPPPALVLVLGQARRAAQRFICCRYIANQELGDPEYDSKYPDPGDWLPSPDQMEVRNPSKSLCCLRQPTQRETLRSTHAHTIAHGAAAARLLPVLDLSSALLFLVRISVADRPHRVACQSTTRAKRD